MIVLCGKSGSGKNTVQDELVKLGMNRIVTYTTRPQRPGEVDGVTYYYVSTSEFHNMKESGIFLESACYFPAIGGEWFYGSSASKFEQNGVLILNPDGVKALTPELIKQYKILIVYLDCPEDILTSRLTTRGDNPAEITRRLKADNRDFEDIDKYVDVTVHSETFLSAKSIAFSIFRTHEKFCSDMKEKHEKV